MESFLTNLIKIKLISLISLFVKAKNLKNSASNIINTPQFPLCFFIPIDISSFAGNNRDRKRKLSITGAMIGKERRSSESLCEKSMLLLANLIKLSSSISFANTANEATAGTSATRQRSGGNSAATPLIPGSRRLQEPQNRAKPIYVTKPGGGSFQISHGSPRYSPSSSSSSSSNVIHGESDCDEANVDGWASKYIERVHRNRKDFDQYPTNEKPYSMGKNRLRRATSVPN